MKLLEALRNATKELESSLENSRLFEHNPTIGTFREDIIKYFLRPYLPEAYSLASGQIFDSLDNMSKQIDVIIYDELFSPILFKGKTNSLIPFEAMYGTIEVKSNLNTSELSTSIENIKSVRSLSRKQTTAAHLLPHHGSFISEKPGNIIQYNKDSHNNPFNVIFGFDGIKSDKCLETLNNLVLDHKQKPLLPDFIFNYKQGYMIGRGSINQKDDKLWLAYANLENFHGDQPYDAFFSLNLGDDLLPMFFLTTNLFLNLIRLETVDIVSIWNKVFRNAVESQ